MDPFSVALGIGGIASNLISNARNQFNFNRQLAFTDRQQREAMSYNSEVRKVQRLRAAGLNPQLQGLQTGMMSAQSAPSPVPATPLDMNGLSSMAQGLNMNGVNAENVQNQANLTKLNSFAQQMQNALTNRFGFEKASQELKKLTNDALLSAFQGDYTEAGIQVQKALEHYYYASGSKAHWESQALEKEFPYVVQRVQKYLANMDAQNRLLNFENEINQATKSDQIGQIQDSAKAQNKALEMIDNVIELGHKQNNAFYFQVAAELITGIGNMIGNFVGLGIKKKQVEALISKGMNPFNK